MNSYYEKIGSNTSIMDPQPSFDLSEGWCWTRLATYCLPQQKRTPSGQSFSYIDIDSIDNKAHKICKPKTVATKDAPSRAQRAVSEGSTLFSIVRPYLENIAFVKSEHVDCIASTGFYVCTPVDRNCGLALYYTLLSQYCIQAANEHMKGDNSPSVRKEDMDNMLVPIAPFPEQERISSLVEKLLGGIEG